METTSSWWRKTLRFFRLYLIASLGILPCAILYASLTGHGAGFGPRAASILLGIFSGLALWVAGDHYLSRREVLKPASVEVSADKSFSNAIFVISTSSKKRPLQHALAGSNVWKSSPIAA
jgi:hypothetical protein